MIEIIFSGGQTGVDRAALDAAIAHGVPHGGWCPRGRRAEDGPIPARYRLRETPAGSYEERTAWNVRDSDGTLVVNQGALEGGTALTLELARMADKPSMLISLDGETDIAPILDWIARSGITRLNVAGPRESKRPGIHSQARVLMDRILYATQRR